MVVKQHKSTGFAEAVCLENMDAVLLFKRLRKEKTTIVYTSQQLGAQICLDIESFFYGFRKKKLRHLQFPLSFCICLFKLENEGERYTRFEYTGQ